MRRVILKGEESKGGQRKIRGEGGRSIKNGRGKRGERVVT